MKTVRLNTDLLGKVKEKIKNSIKKGKPFFFKKQALSSFSLPHPHVHVLIHSSSKTTIKRPTPKPS